MFPTMFKPGEINVVDVSGDANRTFCVYLVNHAVLIHRKQPDYFTVR